MKMVMYEVEILAVFSTRNLPELAMKHNKFACYEPPCLGDLGGNSTTSTLATGETFQLVTYNCNNYLNSCLSYCCYIPHEGKLYELDGLKEWPIDHGFHGSHWLEKAKKVISARISKARDKDQGQSSNIIVYIMNHII